ncbi:MAG: hypothetical protein AB7K67_07655 [Hyphomicrobiaceae bacterium]
MRDLTIADFAVDLTTRTATIIAVPECSFSFYEYNTAEDWERAEAHLVTNPRLLPAPIELCARLAKLAATGAGMQHRRAA